VLPVADDDNCEIKVSGSKPGTVTALNVGATLVQLEVKSPDGSNSQVNLCLLLSLQSSATFLLLCYTEACYCRLEEPILHLLWGLRKGSFSYNSPKPERIWMKPRI